MNRRGAVLSILLAIGAATLLAQVPDPAEQSQSARSLPDDDGDDCTRAREEQGWLRGLKGYRFEQAPARKEIEQAILANGVPITIIHSGCGNTIIEYRFSIKSAPDLPVQEALELAARLMRSLPEASFVGGTRHLASELAKAASEGEYGLDEDLYGGQDQNEIRVSLESEPGLPVLLIVTNIVAM